MGMDTVAKVAACKLAKAGLSGEVFFSDSREIDLIHGAKRTKPAEALAGRAATELETMLNVIQRKRLLSTEEEAINLSDGARQREYSEDTNKKRDGFELKGTKWRGRSLQVSSPLGSRVFQRQATAFGNGCVLYLRPG